MKQGIDVSVYQGDIDWAKVKQSGIEFAILRAGYGKVISQVDKKFVKNYDNAKLHGIPLGAYWYSYATTVEGAAQEATACLTVLGGRSFDLPIFFDQEYEPGILALTNQQRTEIVKTFTNKIKAAGYKSGLYASLDFIKNKLNDNQIPADVVRWVAQYASKCTYTGKLFAWQKSSNGTVSGISGRVDMDELYGDIGSNTPVAQKKSVTELAQEVIAGLWKTGLERKTLLEAAGYVYSEVQGKVNEILNGSAAKPSNPVQSQTQTVSKDVTASGKAQCFDKSIAKQYQTTADLYLRDNAGTSNKALCVIPKGTSVQCYGYYSFSGNSKWYYIQTVIDGVKYTGFSSSAYLK